MTPSLYVHPDSPLSGGQVSKQMCSFEKLKLTNNDLDQNSRVSSKPSGIAEHHSFATVFSKKPNNFQKKTQKTLSNGFQFPVTAKGVVVVLLGNYSQLLIPLVTMPSDY